MAVQLRRCPVPAVARPFRLLALQQREGIAPIVGAGHRCADHLHQPGNRRLQPAGLQERRGRHASLRLPPPRDTGNPVKTNLRIKRPWGRSPPRQQTVGLPADLRTHRLPADGASVYLYKLFIGFLPHEAVPVTRRSWIRDLARVVLLPGASGGSRAPARWARVRTNRRQCRLWLGSSLGPPGNRRGQARPGPDARRWRGT